MRQTGKRRKDGRGRNIQNPVGWGVIHSGPENQIWFVLAAGQAVFPTPLPLLTHFVLTVTPDSVIITFLQISKLILEP